ncbi:LysR family transcriptional regulator [Aeribacillus sp. FSL W8-0870]|uniref:LysR family transcriptional regulator n=1 Tax=Aeribacillus sp. FSL W8-0870 TaxID=2954706 RepID=UPI0030CE7DC6
MTNFEWYRSFVAIYRHGSISRAAQARFMTQPALSQHLAALEAEIGEPLFRRTPRQMVPTERGHMLYGQIVQAVDRLEKISGDFRHPSTPPTLRIGGPAEWIHEYLIARLPESPYTLSFTFGETKPLIQALKNNDIDLLIATQHVATSGLTFTRLMTETFKLVGNRPMPSDGYDRDDIRQRLERLDWISYAPELPIIRRFWFAAFGERCTLKPRFIVPDLRVIKSLVLQGHGISVLPEYLVADELKKGELYELWRSPEPVENDLWLVYRSSDRVDPTFTTFVDSWLRAAVVTP